MSNNNDNNNIQGPSPLKNKDPKQPRILSLPVESRGRYMPQGPVPEDFVRQTSKRPCECHQVMSTAIGGWQAARAAKNRTNDP